MAFRTARRLIPHCYLGLGDLEKASEGFRAQIGNRTGQGLNEEIDYYLAMIGFFRQEYDSTTAALRKLIVDYPRGLFNNDAQGYRIK